MNFRRFCISFLCVVLFGGAIQVWGQGEPDAFKYSETDISGTARYMGMAGAFNALGGDVSAIVANPAGIGLYRSGEVVGTLGLGIYHTSCDMGEGKGARSLFKPTFRELGFVSSFYNSKDRSGLLGMGLSISCNRVKDFNRTYTTQSGGFSPTYSDYMANSTTLNGYDAHFMGDRNAERAFENYDWLSVLGYNGYAFDTINNSTTYRGIGELNSSDLTVTERGYIDEYNFSFGGNVSDKFYFGVGFGIRDLNYRLTATYQERFKNNSSYEMYNVMESRGTGVNFKFGFIVRPVDFLRIGVALHTPTWYNTRDEYDAEINYKRPNYATGRFRTPYGSYRYKFQTPLRFATGIAFVLGKSAIISFDYELQDIATTSFSSWRGREDRELNHQIESHGQIAHTFKVGAEFRVLPAFSLRAGGALITSSVKDAYQNGEDAILTAGTISNFTTERSTCYGTLGAGYKFDNMFLDFAFIYRNRSEYCYYFPSYVNQTGMSQKSPKGKLNTNSYNLFVTFGVKF